MEECDIQYNSGDHRLLEKPEEEKKCVATTIGFLLESRLSYEYMPKGLSGIFMSHDPWGKRTQAHSRVSDGDPDQTGVQLFSVFWLRVYQTPSYSRQTPETNVDQRRFSNT